LAVVWINSTGIGKAKFIVGQNLGFDPNYGF
jgi:hypothetical protein